MDDLLGEDWQTASKPKPVDATARNLSYGLQHNSLRASPAIPTSGVTTPQSISRPSSTTPAVKNPPQKDRFENLLSLKSQKPTKPLTLLEQQQKALSEKRRQQEEQSQLWDTLGSNVNDNQARSGTPKLGQSYSGGSKDEEDDILAAFNKAAPVNNASHFPPPRAEALSGGNTIASTSFSQNPDSSLEVFNDDDDPFGLGTIANGSNRARNEPGVTHHDNDEEDILGDLGRPISELAPKKAATRENAPRVATREPQQDGAVAELVDMGFPIDNARLALAENDGDVQRAVGWLLQQAHEESKQKAKQNLPERQQAPPSTEAIPSSQSRDAQRRAGADRHGGSTGARRHDTASPARSDKDAAQIASELGNKLFKGANSLWKASQKQMTKTIAEFQQERDSSSPKWMQEAVADTSRSGSQNRARQAADNRRVANITDEAAMLDMPREEPASRTSRPASSLPTNDPPSRARSPMAPLTNKPVGSMPSPAQQAPQPEKRYASRVSRLEVEEQSAQAYVSPARRKAATPKPQPRPQPQPQMEPEVDLFSPAPVKTNSTTCSAISSQSDHKKPPPISRAPAPPTRPTPAKRDIPAVSASALSSSAAHRKIGGEAFKRGDFGSAHESYTRALTPLPATHPVTIIVLVNRCLTALKTGDAKMAVADADRALAIIGDSKGIGEVIDLGAGEASKDMRDFYGKALMRKAEALEHLEKWTEAAGVWHIAIAAGIGGATSIRGRDRCEKASAPQTAAPKPRPATTAPRANTAPPSAGLQRPAVSSATSAEAVKKLRAANAAAEKADDEKFALYDQVEARLASWKGGKADNLRALLQSLDAVLWPEAGWKKVGMSDLVMPNKVKIIYMKAIAKVHPDKVSRPILDRMN
jgi:hypothetical protein